jgi:hypothetical protein
MSLRYLQLHKFCAESGYTEKAVRRKIQDGIWIEGQQWRKAPDGHVMIDIEGYERWVEGQRVLSNLSSPPSVSSSRTRARAA